MPQIYISAPFRRYSSEIEGREYGILYSENYRQFLEKVEQLIKELGFKVCLPHRDEGLWGNIYIPPEEITEICFNLIRSSEILVVFPGKSRGVHIEIGYAAALGKKMLVFLHEGEKESTLLRGISRITEMKMFRYKSTDEIMDILKSELQILKSSASRQTWGNHYGKR